MEQDNLRELAVRLWPVFRKYKVIRAIVFGSMARGDASRRSDLDLLVIQETEKRFLDRYDGLLRDVAEAVPERPVDLLLYTAEELAQLSDRTMIETALREGKLLYEQGQESIPF